MSRAIRIIAIVLGPLCDEWDNDGDGTLNFIDETDFSAVGWGFFFSDD